jgi:hypothetical protein
MDGNTNGDGKNENGTSIAFCILIHEVDKGIKQLGSQDTDLAAELEKLDVTRQQMLIKLIFELSQEKQLNKDLGTYLL